MNKLWILVIVCLLGGFFHWRDRPIERAAGVLAPKQPVQEAITESSPVWEKNGYRIRPLARFEIEARVLSKETYRFDREAELAPVDLALGWGRMSDSAVLAWLDIEQRHRFYYWRTQTFPIPRREIETHSANMHLIPANRIIEKKLKALRSGNLVKLSGFLAEAQADDGWRWTSSLTREDTGNGACELIWVERLEAY